MISTFEQDLDKLRTRLVRMGSLVEEQVEFAFRSLGEGNSELARIVVERDDKVDKLDLKIDKQCQRIFALSQPVARDLRLLLSAMKINNELERIGDMASDICEVVLEAPNAVALGQKIELQRLTATVHKLLKSSIDAFINDDPELAAHVLPSDTTVNQLYATLSSKLIEVMEGDASSIRDGSRLLLTLHNLQRIADHATNIAENVIFLVRAKLVRHRTVNNDGMDLADIIKGESKD